MSLLDAVTGIFAGGAGLTTVISGGISAFVNLKEKKIANAHELAMQPFKEKEWEFMLTQQKRSIANDEFMAEKGLIESQTRSANDLTRSAIQSDMQEVMAALQMQGQRWWVGAIRTLNRPALTWGLLLVMFVTIFVDVDQFNQVQAATIITLSRMGEAAFGFWFGGRIVRSGQ